MSRIGKQPISIPDKVNVTVHGQEVTVKGPKGELKHNVHPNIHVQHSAGVLHFSRQDDERQNRALHGLERSLVANMIEGVSKGYKRTLNIEGVGYGSDLRGKDLVMRLGFSHEIVVNPPANITFEIEDRGRVIHINGIDKQVVGQVAANIRELRPPEPYLGKGIRYSDEIVRRKAGKTGK